MRGRLTAACAVLALTAGVTLSATGAQGASTRTVHVKDIDFSPHVLRISRGTTVRWLFQDVNTPHTVTSRGHTKFHSSHTMQSGSYRYRFTRSGTYRYVCTIHPNMKASIVVR